MKLDISIPVGKKYIVSYYSGRVPRIRKTNSFVQIGKIAIIRK